MIPSGYKTLLDIVIVLLERRSMMILKIDALAWLRHIPTTIFAVKPGTTRWQENSLHFQLPLSD
jgi:hypothetical protein